MKREVIVVLGMHRSGTSAVTRGLAVLGVELGDNLMRPNADNPRGYWENKDIVSLNILVLETLGIKWNSLSPVPPSRWQAPLVRELEARAAGIIRRNSQSYPRWGFKDPRTLRLLPFWVEAFQQAGISPKYLLVVRNPVSVARSLYQRDGIAPEQSYLLWSANLVPHLAQTRGSLSCVVDYDLLMDDPVFQLKRMAAQLALPVNRAGTAEKMQEYAQRFLSAGLRHSRHTGEDLDHDPAADPLTRAAYPWLARLARDEISPFAPAFWREWSRLGEGPVIAPGADTARLRYTAKPAARLIHSPLGGHAVRVPGNAGRMTVIRRQGRF